MASAAVFGPSGASLSTGRLSPDDEAMIDLTRSVRDLLGGKWKVDVLYLLARGPRRHTWLFDHLLGISKKMLTDTLRGLERDGLVTRTIYAEIPVRVEYALTPVGWSATGLLMQFFEWGEGHLVDVELARSRFDGGGDASVATGGLHLVAASAG